MLSDKNVRGPIKELLKYYYYLSQLEKTAYLENVYDGNLNYEKIIWDISSIDYESFKELFDNNINQSLPDYLRQIYRFFGLWIIIIGFFVLGLSSSSMLENSKIRIILLACVGVMSYSGLLLAIIWIPKSPFVYLGCSMVAIHVLTFYSHIKIS